MSFTFRRRNSGLSLATAPSSVVHTGVKSLGWENSTAHESPIHWWNRIGPSVVCAVKSGAVSPSRRPIILSSPQWLPLPLLVQDTAAPALRPDGPTRRVARVARSGHAQRGSGGAWAPRQGQGVPRTARPPRDAARSDEARARTPGRGRGARGEIELPKDVGQVPVHRVLAQDEPLSDLRVAQPLCDELEHVEFARRQHRSGSG